MRSPRTDNQNLERLNARLRRFRNKYAILTELPVSLMFITLTLNEKGCKDRYKQQTIVDATRRAIKLGKPEYYLMIYETHKDGAWHSHIIAPTLDAQKIVVNYTAGYWKIEEVRGSARNELEKYLSKQERSTRQIYCSQKLNLLLRNKKLVERRNRDDERERKR